MKCFLLLFFIGSYSLMVAQAPDGNPSTFTCISSGNWNNTSTWTMVSGTDTDGIPDGDDDVIIANKNAINALVQANINAL